VNVSAKSRKNKEVNTIKIYGSTTLNESGGTKISPIRTATEANHRPIDTARAKKNMFDGLFLSRLNTSIPTTALAIARVR
ncbi:MAG: hypothetical protein KAJ10_16010, partial [Thermodesulfovibrionia bacterium]|nr:hypothetical protein [Thermodesulfovibrionia bacterium]